MNPYYQGRQPQPCWGQDGRQDNYNQYQQGHPNSQMPQSYSINNYYQHLYQQNIHQMYQKPSQFNKKLAPYTQQYQKYSQPPYFENMREQQYSQPYPIYGGQSWQQNYREDHQNIMEQSFRSTSSYSSSYIDEQYQEGESSTWENVGRFGKFDEPSKKKKKKKKKPKVEPPKPKPKVPCIAQIIADQGTFVATEKYVPMAQCPFNSAHLMPQKSLLTHINRCKNSQYARGYLLCRYNPTHYIRGHMLQLHEMQCQDRVKTFEQLLMADNVQEKEPIEIYRQEESTMIQDNRWLIQDGYMQQKVREYEYALLRDF